MAEAYKKGKNWCKRFRHQGHDILLSGYKTKTAVEKAAQGLLMTTGRNTVSASHGPLNEEIYELASQILQASVVDPHPDSAAGHVRAAMSISAHFAGYEAGDLTPEEEAMLLATHGREFGRAGEIGGVNVYDDDGESWVVWVCNPMVSTWITVGQLLDEIGDGMQVIDWYGEPFKITDADKLSAECVISCSPDVHDIPQQGGFANIPKKLFD